MILAGAAAIVTGGAVRIGRSIARNLAERKMDVCVQYRDSESEAEDAIREFRSLGVQATAIQADFSTPRPAAASVISHALEVFGRVDVLVNSASIFEPGHLLDTDEGHWDSHFNVNLKAPFFLTQEFVRRSDPDADRAIVNLVDWRGTRPVPGHLAYSLTKSALVAQTRLLAQELGPGIRVNAVAPGAILPAPGTSEESFQERGLYNPLQRTGTPMEIARAVLFLLDSDFVTGEVLHVTGGEQLPVSSPTN